MAGASHAECIKIALLSCSSSWVPGRLFPGGPVVFICKENKQAGSPTINKVRVTHVILFYPMHYLLELGSIHPFLINHRSGVAECFTDVQALMLELEV